MSRSRHQITWADREPVALISSLESGARTVVLAILTMALAFNWISWTDEQNAAVLGVIAASFVLISAVVTPFVRQKVTPTRAPRSSEGAPLVEFSAEK
jgi:hypothetical protein